MKLNALRRLSPARWPRWLRMTVGAFVFAAFAIALLDNWHQLTAVSWHLEVAPLVISVCLLPTTYFLGVLGWHRTVTSLGGTCTFGTSARVWLYSNLARHLPGGLWYAAGRVMLSNDAGVSPATGTVGVIFEIIYLVVSNVLVVGTTWTFWASHTLPALPWFLPAALIGTALVVVRPGFLARLASFGTGSDSTIRNTKYAIRMPTSVRLQFRDSLEILTIYVAQALLTGVAFYFLVRALTPLPLSLMPFSAGAFALAWLMGFVNPFAPGGLGVREGVLAYLLSPVLTGPVAIMVAILARAWLMAGELLCVGFVKLVEGRWSVSIVMTGVLLNRLFGLIVVVMLVTVPASGVRLGTAASAAAFQPSNLQRTREVTLAELGYETDETVYGVRVSRDFSVDWPDAWSVQEGNAFNLHFSHSPALDPRSTMTVEFNGARLTSVLLTPENADAGTLQVAIPGHLIDVGYNQLRLEFYMGFSDFNCRDLDDPAVWATVHNTSAFHFSYALEIPELDLSRFPAPFIDNSKLVENHVTFILPDEPTPAELNAAVAISAKLGQLAAWRSVHVHTLSGTQARHAEAVSGEIIVVGRADRLRMMEAVMPPLMLWEDGGSVLADRQGEPLSPEAGVLWAHPSPIDEAAVILIVTGLTDEAVLTAGKALASEVSYPRLAGQLGIVLSVPEPAPANEVIGQMVTLEELGYADRTAWGTREQSIGYSVPLPVAWQIQSEATLELHFAHSAIADSRSSFLNVLLNGTPVGSVRLNSDNAEDARATFRLPARLFRPGDNSLVVMSHMEHDAQRGERLDCLDPEPDQAWLVVYADSQLHLPGGPAGVAVDLAAFPPAFIGSANLSELTFIVPDTADRTVAHALIRMAERIGHFAEGETLAPLVIDATTLDSMDSPQGPQILVGRPTQNAAIAHLNDVLPQPFESGTDDPTLVESIAQIVPLEGTVGYIQAVLSGEGQPRLVVTGTTDEGTLWASEVLSDSEFIKKLSGDLIIVSSRGSFVATEIQPQRARQFEEPLATTPSAPSTLRSVGWVKGVSAGLFILTFAILAIVIWPQAHQHFKAGERHGT